MNRFRHRIITAVLVGVGLLLAFAVGNWSAAQSPTAPAAFKQDEPAFRSLDANLFMQTSAEYRACCYQAFNLATLRLKDATKGAKPAKPFAVVMDLDETVFDNAGFQAMQLRSNLAYDQRLWDVWEKEHGEYVGLVPGAKEFILHAIKQEVAVVYISNRNEKFREQTKKVLTRLGIAVDADDRLKLSTDTSDKTKRRKEVDDAYTVVLNIGDNLRDFDESFRSRKIEKKTAEELQMAIQERKDTADKNQTAFGDKWIILPNPAYGEWMKPLGQGKTDLDRLAPSIPSK